MCGPDCAGPKGTPGPPGLPGQEYFGTEVKYWPKWLKNINDCINKQIQADFMDMGNVADPHPPPLWDDFNALIEFWEENKYENPFKQTEK